MLCKRGLSTSVNVNKPYLSFRRKLNAVRHVTGTNWTGMGIFLLNLKQTRDIILSVVLSDRRSNPLNYLKWEMHDEREAEDSLLL